MLDPSNFSPIALLNTCYKLFAACLQYRLQSTMDAVLQSTQFGFRKGRSGLQAIHCIRRFLDMHERAGKKAMILLLDWEKAFDKINHEKMFEALERLVLPKEFLLLIREVERL